MLRLSSLNSLGIFVATIVTSISGLLVSILLSRALGPEAYGRFTYALFLYGTLSTFIALGITHTVSRFGSAAIGRSEIGTFRRLIQWGVTSRFVIWLALSVIVYLFREPIIRLLNLEGQEPLLLIIWLSLLPFAVVTTLQAGFTALLRSDISAIVVLAGAILRISAYAMMVDGDVPVTRLVIVEAVVSCLSVLLYFPLLARQVRKRDSEVKQTPSPNWNEGIYRYSATMAMITTLDFLVWSRSEVVFIQRYLSPEELAYYTVAMGIPEAVRKLIPVAVTRSVMPTIARLAGAGKFEEIRVSYQGIVRIIALVVSPVATGGIILSPEFVQVLYGENYAPAVAPMRLVFLSSIIVSVLGGHSAILYGLGFPGFNLRISAVLAPIGLALNFFMVRNFGILGAAFGNIVIYSLFFVPTVREVQKRTGGVWPTRSLVGIIGAALTMAASVTLIRTLPVDSLARIMIAVPCGAFVYGVMLIIFRAVTQSERRRASKALSSALRRLTLRKARVEQV